MKLQEWADGKGLDLGGLAEKLEAPYHTVRRVVRGERKPDDELMRRIVKATRGEVTANDFYEIGAELKAAKRRAA